MFTGIVERSGRVKSVRRTRSGARIAIESPFGVPVGASVAVNGVCLTSLEPKGLVFDMVPETLSRTTLGRLRAGARVNLERALAAGARLDGHVVQGHVDGTGVVESLTRRGGAVTLTVKVSPALADQIVPKGSIAVDGVSLTVVDAGQGRFSVALIPATLARTTLGRLRKGDRVNIETDVLAKYARRKTESKLTLAFLKKAGFE
ncbi:MAG TPA: riboflavin synthase [Planctomycetota bacterium]|jgi:riboflavin synthase